jgi:AcrR family transcriptional regulator
MSSNGDKTSTAAPKRRPHDAEATREALLEAGRAVFDEVGYDRATTREIGERAGVDPALIARYFECKEGLFLAAVCGGEEERLDYAPRELLAFLLRRWDERGHSPVSRALASPALSEDVRRQVGAAVGEKLLAPLERELRKAGAPRPKLRAELLVALAVGVAMTRANGTLEELAAAPADEVIATLGPLVDVLSSAE